MSQFSKTLLLIMWLFGFILLLHYKGFPAIPTPNPEAIADETFQPVLAVVWGIVGYLFNALWFSWLVVLAAKIIRVLVYTALHPEELVAALASSKAQKEAAQ